MRVTLVCMNYQPEPTGGSVYTGSLADELVERGADFQVDHRGRALSPMAPVRRIVSLSERRIKTCKCRKAAPVGGRSDGSLPNQADVLLSDSLRARTVV
jgi:hypothetical protein